MASASIHLGCKWFASPFSPLLVGLTGGGGSRGKERSRGRGGRVAGRQGGRAAGRQGGRGAGGQGGRGAGGQGGRGAGGQGDRGAGEQREGGWGVFAHLALSLERTSCKSATSPNSPPGSCTWLPPSPLRNPPLRLPPSLVVRPPPPEAPGGVSSSRPSRMTQRQPLKFTSAPSAALTTVMQSMIGSS